MAHQVTILGIAGSLRKQSYNKGALRAAQGLVPPGAKLEIFDIAGIPGFSQDEEKNPPARVVELKSRIRAAGAILLASENAVKVANEAVQALGGAGYTKDWPVERYYRDAKLLDIGAGTNEVRRMLIGREVIGV